MTLWAESFKRNYPNVNIQIQAAGSSTAPPALTEATANIVLF
jgi:phosphate transport system substrate-binding protein